MDNQDIGLEILETISLKDRLEVIRYYKFQVLMIILVSLTLVLGYAIYSKSIYTSTTQIKMLPKNLIFWQECQKKVISKVTIFRAIQKTNKVLLLIIHLLD